MLRYDGNGGVGEAGVCRAAEVLPVRLVVDDQLGCVWWTECKLLAVRLTV